MDKVSMNQVRRRGPLNNRELADDLCADSPTLRELRRVHTQSFGTLIPHVFMGNVLTHVGHCLLKNMGAGAAGSAAEVGAILTTLEGGMTTGDRETRNVISLSFARDAELEPFFELLRPFLGPKMMVQLREK
jgi:hypothetical protein